MSGATTAVMAAAAVVGTAYSIYNGEQQQSTQKKAAEQAQKNAQAAADAQDQATNKVNQKRASPTGALDAAAMAGRAGASGTMLTGPSGVANSALTLGSSSLLGG